MLKFLSTSRAFFVLLCAIVLFSLNIFAQTPKPTPRNAKANLVKPKTPKVVLNEKDEFEKAVALTDLNEKVKALEKFIVDFPKSEKKNEALEIVTSIRAVRADEKLRAGELETGIQLFKDTVSGAPNPIPEGLFANVILPIPSKLYFIGQQSEALKIATAIESKIKDDPKQLLGLATFYLGIENAEGARMLAQSAIDLDGTMPAAYQTLGLAYRLKFDLGEAEKSYARALELAPDSVVSKRSLAEMKRAAGKSDEAVALYRELVEKDASDVTAQNGLILALFDAGKREEAESLLGKSLEADPKNLVLLVGAAYWYAAHNEGAKAIDLGQKAVDLAPRYVWARIALARGQMAQKSPLEAEKTLLLAQKYGSFPTLDYELATARFQAGLFEEAVRELKKRFAVKDGYVQTYLAGRTIMEAQSFTELLSLERRASIFTPNPADSADEADKLKYLLDLNLKLANKDAAEDDINQAVDEFTRGDDRMKTHRQLYAASRLLEAKRSLPKVLELAQGAVKGVDNSLDVLNPSAAVLADELIESRTLAISKDEVLVIPEVPAQILSRIIRGKIEELAGWALYQQDKTPEAIVRLKRAVSILPDKSAWSRSSYWKLGLALDAGGNSKESLDALVKSYLSGQPDRFRRTVIEGVYRKVNGNSDGLDKLIGANPFPETVAQVTETPAPTPAVGVSPSPTPESTPEVKTETTPTPDESPKAEPSPTPATEPSPSPTVEATPSPTPEATRTPQIEPTPTPTAEASPTPNITPTPEVKTEPSPTPETTPETKDRVPTPSPKVEPTVPPKLEVKIEDMTQAKTVPAATPKPLFDSVVIEVGKSTSAENKETAKPVEKTTEKTDENKEKPAENKEKAPDEPGRPRVVIEDKIEPPSCVAVSQESISILGNGGNLGVLVGLSQEGDASKITAESSSPNDIQVSLESGIGKQSNRAFFVVRSISSNKGVFTVTFTSACGKKAIQVKVR